jgi:hypothetical protein
VGLPLHRVDVRVQRRFNSVTRVGGRDVQTYNLFNHANYGSYTTAESNAEFRKARAEFCASVSARMVQLGRIGF